MRNRLDKVMVERGLAETRSQAENWIKLGQVTVDGRVIDKAGHMVSSDEVVSLNSNERYVSRAGLKLASVAKALRLNFTDKVVLDVGSSTGGFTDYALQHGAQKVYAVDVGTEQLHPSLRSDSRIELFEKTDIRDFVSNGPSDIDMVLIDVSFVSLRHILPAIHSLSSSAPNHQHPVTNTQIIAMVKPQFEASRHQVSKGVVKNDSVRRSILRDFELWVKNLFIIVNKADSEVAGARGNKERFYELRAIEK